MRLLRELRAEGYEVAGAMFLKPDPRPTVFSVKGHGVQLYVHKDDFDRWFELLALARGERRRRELMMRLAVALSGRLNEQGKG